MLLKDKDLYEFEGFVLDTSERTLWRENESVSITPKAIETLCLLVENHGKLMSKDDLMNSLWAETFVEERNLAQNIFTLRKILGENEHGKKFIETVPRRGYRFVAEVRPVEIEEEEFIEISLENQTTVKAEGNVSAHDLTEAVKQTAKSLALDDEIKQTSVKRVEIEKSSKSFSRKYSFAVASLFPILLLGAFFWFNSKNKTNPKVFAGSNLLNLQFERLTDSGKAFLPAISPDKKQIAYVSNEKGKDALKLQNLATGSITEILPPTADTIIGPPFFSKDGDYVFYRFYDGGMEGTIYKIPIFGGTPRKIIGEVRSDASISPDGIWISFVRYKAENDAWQIIICRTDGTDERVVASRSGDKIFLDWGQTPAWSPDGRKIVIGGMTKNSDKNSESANIYLLELDVADGSEKILPTPKWNNFEKIVWHPNGKQLLVIAQESREKPSQIWNISYPDGKAKRITNDLNNYIHLDISSDGEFILTSQKQTNFNLWTVSLKDKTAKQITDKSAILVGAGGVKWSPNGKQIVYTVAENTFSSNIWTIDPATHETRQLTFDENKRNWLPTFSPDSQTILFASDRAGKSNIWQMDADGKNPRRITEGDGEGFPQVTPDGNWLIYITPAEAPRFLHKRPINGGESIIIYDNAKGNPAISTDSQKILFGYYDNEEKQKDPWKYGIKSLEPDDKPQEISVKPYYGSMVWTKDNKGFYYVSEGRTLNNIWFYSISDGSTEQITDFDEMKFRFLSLSPDETQIATTRSSTISNIIRIKDFQ